MSEHPELWSSAANGIGREGMVTVWNHLGEYVGCLGVEKWNILMNEHKAMNCWHVIDAEALVGLLRRAAAGESPDLLYFETYVNGQER